MRDEFAFTAHLFYFVSKWQNPKSKIESPIVSIIMGSTSDWETMKNASDILTEFGVAYETRVVSAHRTPDLLFEFAKTAESRGIEVNEARLDVIKTENLYNFDGERGYSA